MHATVSSLEKARCATEPGRWKTSSGDTLVCLVQSFVFSRSLMSSFLPFFVHVIQAELTQPLLLRASMSSQPAFPTSHSMWWRKPPHDPLSLSRALRIASCQTWVSRARSKSGYCSVTFNLRVTWSERVKVTGHKWRSPAQSDWKESKKSRYTTWKENEISLRNCYWIKKM